MIPKIIHTCWFTKDPNYELSPKVKRCIESWKKYCPDYEIKVWGINDWDYEQYPHAKQCWEAGVASYAYLSNFFRFWVLYNYGGFYLESDMLLNDSLEPIRQNNDKAFMGVINPRELSGALMGSIPGHHIFKYFIDLYKNRPWINPDHSLNLYHDSGLIGDEIMKLGYNFQSDCKEAQHIKGDFTVYPKLYFYPDHLSDGIYAAHIGSLTHYRKVSVVMPVWNSEKYLREAIDSVLSQEFGDFELLCIDDGSTDSSAEIINSYTDDRVVYIHKKHSGIVDSLNIGFRRAIGDFIVRFDSDDIMLPGRLSHQVKYMMSNPHIDILGSGFQWGNGKSVPEYYRCPEKQLKISDFSVGNKLGHPATIIRRRRILTLPHLYENYFEGVEDYKLWLFALSYGLTIYTEPTPVIIYRQHDDQITNSESYKKKSWGLLERAKRIYITSKTEFIKEPPRLTCIIPFQNEGDEVERTAANIRATAGRNVEIILINDSSDDNFDYARVARVHDCRYFKTPKNFGVAGSRNFGVSKCDTQYFLLLDAHMRFYEDNWHEFLLKSLDENPGCLVSSNTTVFTYDKSTKIYSNEEGSSGRDRFGTYGAIVNLSESGWEFTAKWTGKVIEEYKNSDEEIIPISCCLGAVYAMSREYWYKIGGLNGLIKYGLDEPLISLKVWLSGGKVLLIKKWGVGHLYRSSSPYSVPLPQMDQNHIYLINLFGRSSDEIQLFEERLKKRIGDSRFNIAKETFEKHRGSFQKFKDYFFKDVAVRDLDWFIENINNKIR